MMRHIALAIFMTLGTIGAGAADPVTVELAGSASNAASPQMGDNLVFHSRIQNTGATPAEGLIAWLSLIEVDPGNEQPVDLEDWSAQKAVTLAMLAPGAVVETDWPLRLIQSGRYRVVVNAMSRSATDIAASAFTDFAVREKPVVESQRVLPIAIGVPGILSLVLLWRWRRQRQQSPDVERVR